MAPIRRTRRSFTAPLAASDFTDAFWKSFHQSLGPAEVNDPRMSTPCRVSRAKDGTIRTSMHSGRTRAGKIVTLHPRSFAALYRLKTIDAGLMVSATCHTIACVEHNGIDTPQGLTQFRAADTEDVDMSEEGPTDADGCKQRPRKRISIEFFEDELEVIKEAAAAYYVGEPNLSRFLHKMVMTQARIDAKLPKRVEKLTRLNEALAKLSEKPSVVAEYVKAQEGSFALPEIEPLLPPPLRTEQPPEFTYPNGIKVAPPEQPIEEFTPRSGLSPWVAPPVLRPMEAVSRPMDGAELEPEVPPLLAEKIAVRPWLRGFGVPAIPPALDTDD